MCLVELVKLVFGLLLADDGLPLAVLEALEDSFVVELHLVSLLLFLLELQLDELQLLFGDGLILDGLTLEGLVLLFELSNHLLQLLYPFAVLGGLIKSLSISLLNLDVKLCLKALNLLCQLLFGLFELLHLFEEGLLPACPLLAGHRELLLFILLRVLQFKDGFSLVLDFLLQLPNVCLVLGLCFSSLIQVLRLLVLQLLKHLLFFLILLLRLLIQVLNLLEIECLLLVKLTLLAFLQSLCLFLCLKGCIHLLSDLSGASLGLFTRSERLLFGLQLNTLSFFEGLGETLATSLLSGSTFSLCLLCSAQLGLQLLTLLPPFILGLN